MPDVNYIIGNSYDKIPKSRAKLDRSGAYLKQHDWTVYVDVWGDPDVVKKVEFHMGQSFSPPKFVSHCPIKMGIGHWRFQTRQQTWGSTKRVKVSIVGAGGTVFRRDFQVELSPGGTETEVETFLERRQLKPLPPIAMPNVNFGVELELSTSPNVTVSDIVRSIRSGASVSIKDMTSDYSGARGRNDIWKIMHDGSLTCSISNPGCNKFELVSPILTGGDGLGEVDHVMRTLKDLGADVSINQSMGFHCHIDVSTLTLADMKKICQNYCKYESAIDSMMPASRRGSKNEFSKSNRQAVGDYDGASNRTIHTNIAQCQSLAELGNLVSPNRYYKLNLRPIVDGRQTTIEFRQHSGTYSKDKVKNWVRFCMAFVQNSSRLRAPSYITKNNSEEKLFEMMFMYVIKDRCLRDFYHQRRIELAGSGGDDCCTGCEVGSGCAGANVKMPY